jgi:two-component sensor histidine kinase
LRWRAPALQDEEDQADRALNRSQDTSDVARPHQWSGSRRSILALGASLTVLSILLFALVAEGNRRSSIEDAARTVRTLAVTLAEHAARIVEVGNLLADRAIELAEGRTWDQVEGLRSIHEALKRLGGERDFVNALWLVDEAGWPRASTRGFPPPRQSVADRQHFVVQKAGDVGPYLSSPMQSRVEREENMVLSRRIADADGAFRGAALVVLNPDQFQKVYREVQPRYPATIELVRDDGSLVMLHRVPGGPVEDVPPATRLLATAESADPWAMTASRRIGTMPLYIVVGVAHADVTRRWLGETMVSAGVVAAVLGVVLLFVLVAAFRSGQELTARAETEALNAGLEKRIQDRTATIERLMVEVNHRVKNSLQTISSLLHMHARMASRADVRQELEEARSRVMTIARVHDRLYRTEQVTTVKLDELLRDIGEDLAPALITVDGIPARLRVEGTQVEISVDQAVPLALAVNELVTNAVKHAFPEGRAGHISVMLELIDEANARLGVDDDGIGLPQGFDPKASSGLGMGLVIGLVSQAGGTFTYGRSARGGARFVIEFPLSKASIGS